MGRKSGWCPLCCRIRSSHCQNEREAMMCDELEKDGKYPTKKQKYMVNVVIELPNDDEAVVEGNAVAVNEEEP